MCCDIRAPKFFIFFLIRTGQLKLKLKQFYLSSPVLLGETVTYHFSYLVAVILSDSNLAIIPCGSLIVVELPDG